MSKKPDGGPAYPCNDIVRRDGKGGHFGVPVSSQGKTLRDDFAGKALMGITAGYWSNDGQSGLTPYDLANEAYQLADAMLKAREE